MLTHTVDTTVASEIQTELLIPSFLPFWHLACTTFGKGLLEAKENHEK